MATNKTKRTFEVEAILESRGQGANKEYLIKWKDYPGANSWEPIQNCKQCTALIKEFEERKRRAGGRGRPYVARKSTGTPNEKKPRLAFEDEMDDDPFTTPSSSKPPKRQEERRSTISKKPQLHALPNDQEDQPKSRSSSKPPGTPTNSVPVPSTKERHTSGSSRTHLRTPLVEDSTDQFVRGPVSYHEYLEYAPATPEPQNNSAQHADVATERNGTPQVKCNTPEVPKPNEETPKKSKVPSANDSNDYRINNGDEVEEVVGLQKKETRLMCVVKYTSGKFEAVPNDLVKQLFPQPLITYYEKRLVFH
uniref:Chromo domain-containing protein n=1 Tax=Steinernema glaseri TaxID=37863 RepID=A0A1I8ARS7_9BILA